MGSTLLNTDDGNDLHPNLALSSSCHSQVHRKKKQEEIAAKTSCGCVHLWKAGRGSRQPHQLGGDPAHSRSLELGVL